MKAKEANECEGETWSQKRVWTPSFRAGDRTDYPLLNISRHTVKCSTDLISCFICKYMDPERKNMFNIRRIYKKTKMVFREVYKLSPNSTTQTISCQLSPDSLNNCSDFKICWVKTNVINSVKHFLRQILYHCLLLVNLALKQNLNVKNDVCEHTDTTSSHNITRLPLQFS